MAKTATPRRRGPSSLAPEPAKVEATYPKIPPEVRAWANRPSTAPPRIDPFAVAVHPPGVMDRVPKAQTMAMDDAISETNSWAQGAFAAQNAIYSAFSEGTVFLGYAYLAILAQRAEYRVPAEIIATECTREWIEFSSISEDEGQAKKIKELEDELEKFQVKRVTGLAVYGDGLFGRGHIYVDTEDADDAKDAAELKTPIGDGRSETSKTKVRKGSLKGFKAVEAVWAYPTDYNSNDPLRNDWYRPNIWHVMGKDVHRTRFLTLIGREVPDLLKPAYSFGGLSLSQMIKPYVDNWLRTRQSVADLIRSFTVWIVKTNLQALLQAGGEDLKERVDLFNNMRDNQSAAMVDKDAEDIGNVSAPLGSLDALQAQSQEHMSGVSRIPLVKLFGISPHGLNASSEGEIRAFYDWIKAFQEHLLRVPLTTIVDFVQLHLWGEVDQDITWKFRDLWQLDEAGRIAIEKTKTDIDDANAAIGAVSPEEIRERLAKDPESIYEGLDLSEPLPEPDPVDPGMEGGEEGGGGELPEVKDPSNRLATSVTNRAANAGGGASGLGFTGT